MLIHELVIRVDAIRHCIFWMEGMPFDARLGEIDIYYQSPQNIDGNYTGECIKIK